MSSSPQGAPASKEAPYNAKELLILAGMGIVGTVDGGFDAVLAGLSTTKGVFEALKTGFTLQLASVLGQDSVIKPGEMGRLEGKFTDCVAVAAQGVIRATTSIPQGTHDGLRVGKAIVTGVRDRRAEAAAAQPQGANETTHNPLHRVAVGVDGVLAQLKDFYARLTAESK